MYAINEVSGPDNADLLRYLNDLVPTFPELTDDHLYEGFWWLIQSDETVGFCGMVPFHPFDGVWYAKRCFLRPSHRGNGLQIRSLATRELKAREIGGKQIVSETTNPRSAKNMIAAGFAEVIPEQKWGDHNSRYFAKVL